jgi:hypothetical protein
LTAAHSLSGPTSQPANPALDAEQVNPRQTEIFDEGFFDLFNDDDSPDLPTKEIERKTPDLQVVSELNTPRSIFLVASPGSSSNVSMETSAVPGHLERGLQVAHFSGWLTVPQAPLSVAEQHANPDLDWALLTLENEESFSPVNWIQTGKSSVTTLVPSKDVPRGEVLVVSKATWYRRAYCSGVPALISLPGSDELRKVYSISSHASAVNPKLRLNLALRETLKMELAQGESGSLVVDANSGEAFGLIVAESRDLKLTYMIPIQDIFKDISKKWHGDAVSFPEAASGATTSFTAKDDIRLFVLEPGSADEAIRGNLISSRPEFGGYEFLSYVWETNIRSQPIYVDGKTVLIPPSLEDLFRCLRLNDRPRTFWVDAICINREDSAEMNRLVHQNPLIALKASQVCIWLGKEGKDTALAFDLIEQTQELNSSDGYARLWEEPAESDRIVALRSLMKRPWFSRRWIVQEIAYARKASIHCGLFRADWRQFAEVVMLLTSVWNDDARTGDISHLAATRLVHLCGFLFRETEDGTLPVHLLPLDSLVCGLADFKISNPLDAIYALLSLARTTKWPANFQTASSSKILHLNISDLLAEQAILKLQTRILQKEVYDARFQREYTSNRLPSLHARISSLHARMFINILCTLSLRSALRNEHQKKVNPRRRLTIQGLTNGAKSQSVSPDHVDYNQSFDEVEIDFVLRTALESGSIDIICRAWAPMFEERDLPSWIRSVKHAEYGTSPTGDPSRVNAAPLTTLRGLETPRYSAGGSLWTQPTRDGKTLTVEGFVLGTVIRAEDPALLGNIPWIWLRLGGWKRPDQAVPAQLWRTLVADRDSNGQHAPMWYSLACKHGLQQFTEGGDIDVGQLLAQNLPARFADFWSRVRKVIWSRRLISASAGILGLAPRTTQPTDLICVLRGCSVPVVLRERRGVIASNLRSTFELLGECFVYGMMDGEALELNAAQTKFVLT